MTLSVYHGGVTTSYKNKLLPHIDWHEDMNIEYHQHTSLPHLPSQCPPHHHHHHHLSVALIAALIFPQPAIVMIMTGAEIAMMPSPLNSQVQQQCPNIEIEPWLIIW